MAYSLTPDDIKAIAYQTAIIAKDLVKKELAKREQPDLVPTAEAARILGITPHRLRQIVCDDPQRYPHTKRGASKQAKLLFDRNALIKSL